MKDFTAKQTIWDSRWEVYY